MLLKDFASLFTRCKQFRFKRVVAPFHHVLIPKLDLLEDRCLPATILFALRSAAPKYGPDGSRINRGQRFGPDGAEIPRNLPHNKYSPKRLGAI